MSDETTAVRLVTRLFLRRLVDHDVISPHADRHESLAVLYALVLSLAVFVTFFVTSGYLAAFIQFPGLTAMSALSDRFLFIAASMTVGALGALMVWDGLAVEPRDAMILGPLPISARTIAHAKLAAIFVLGAVLTIALNAVPSVLYPVFLTLNLRGMGGGGIARLIAGHATAVTMAGLHGFLGVLATRGMLSLVLGERGFERASSAVQSVLVVCTVTALLVSPTVRTSDVHDWVARMPPRGWPAVPVLGYLGVNETLAGRIVAETPVVMPPRFEFVSVQKKGDEAGRSAYRALLPEFARLAKWACLSLPLVTALALTTFLWSNRRLPDRSAARPAPARLHTALLEIAERVTRRDPEGQAGFFFTLQVLARSPSHRTVVAVALAAGLTHLVLTLVRLGRMPAIEAASKPLGWFAIDIVLLVSQVAGFRYAVTVPAELTSNWTIRMAWLGDERGYLGGVKRAGVVLLAMLPLLMLLPLDIVHLGLVDTAVHCCYVLVFAKALLDGLFLGYRKMPFVCTYLPIQNPKLVWPAGITSLLLVSYGFADLERLAFQTAAGAIGLGVVLGAMALGIKVIDRRQRRERQTVNFDERPVLPTQRLGLFEHVVTDS